MVCVHVQTAILTSKGYYPVALLKQSTPIIVYEDGEFRSIPLEFSLGKHGFHRTRLNQEDEVKWNGNWIPGGGFSQWTTLPVSCSVQTKEGPVPLNDKPKHMPIFDIRMLGIQQTYNLDYLDEEKTHQFYWEKPVRLRNKPIHPMENDDSLPEKIRGKHFDSWTQLAKELGYGE